jgi:bifunctional DNA-binding transcriptional regulator/antitoxin component of YhaV-PrlF toxin-antitoxin module
MTKVLNVNERGTLTLPKKMRQQLGVEGGAQVVAEVREDGILLRARVAFPVEMYSEKRLAEFGKHNDQALGDVPVVHPVETAEGFLMLPVRLHTRKIRNAIRADRDRE